MARLSISGTPLQHYHHNYVLVLMTGLLGCRWHRYMQSRKGSRKVDIVLFMFLFLTATFVTGWFYFTFVMKTDKINFNIFMRDSTGSYIDWFMLLQAVVSTLFAYAMLLMLLSICHVVQGHQLYLHPCHGALMFVMFCLCVALTVATLQIWREEYAVIYLSLQIFGPFLQIGAVCLMTVSSWLIAHEWFSIVRLELKVFSLIVYAFLLLGLYVSPLFINSPCVIAAEKLPTKPRLFAHRGASAITPENTLLAIKEASRYDDVFGIEVDVRICADGVPYVLHDDHLRRTTNVEEVYPDLASLHADFFNITQLQSLSAGKWFLKYGPDRTLAGSGGVVQAEFVNQTVPTFLEVLHLALYLDLAVMFDVYLPPVSHPYYNDTLTIINDVIYMSSVNKSKIFWTAGTSTRFENITIPSAYQRVAGTKGMNSQTLKKNNFSAVNLEHVDFDKEYFRDYKSAGLKQFVYIVDSGWLYSYYWCLGVDFVHTNYCNMLSKQASPIWHMSPTFYLVLWVAVDSVSAVLVVAMFLIQRHRLFGQQFHPDQTSLSLNSSLSGHGNWGHKRARRSMKEKLLMRDLPGDTCDLDHSDHDFGIDSRGYEITMNAEDGQALSQAFHSNRESYYSDDGFQGNGDVANGRESLTMGLENGDLLTISRNRNSYNSLENTNPEESVTEIMFNRNRTNSSFSVTGTSNI